MSAAAAGAAAAAAAEQMRQEEEEMTKYTEEELRDGWEFKILRSTWGSFKKPDVLRQVIEEEARAGWTLVEKFDDSRLRFKRPVSARASDRGLSFDPYRTTYGSGCLTMVVLALVAVSSVAFL